MEIPWSFVCILCAFNVLDLNFARWALFKRIIDESNSSRDTSWILSKMLIEMMEICRCFYFISTWLFIPWKICIKHSSAWILGSIQRKFCILTRHAGLTLRFFFIHDHFLHVRLFSFVSNARIGIQDFSKTFWLESAF